MKPPFSLFTTNNTTTTKAKSNPITKYFKQHKSTSTKQYTKTQNLINKIQTTTKKIISKLKHRIKTFPKSQPHTLPQSTFFRRPSHDIPQHNLSSASLSNNSSLVSSSFTSNDCSHYSQHLSHSTYNNINTTYHRLSNCSTSSNSSENLKNVDGKSLPNTNVVTFNGIQRLMELDRHKIQNIIQSKHSYQYDLPFYSSDSNMYAPSALSAKNIPPQSPAIPHVTTII